MNKRTSAVWLLMMALASTAAVAKDKKIQIASDSSGLPAALVENIAATSAAMGVKEPLNISISGEGANRAAVVSGSSGASCKIKLSAGGSPTMMGVSGNK